MIYTNKNERCYKTEIYGEFTYKNYNLTPRMYEADNKSIKKSIKILKFWNNSKTSKKKGEIEESNTFSVNCGNGKKGTHRNVWKNTLISVVNP